MRWKVEDKKVGQKRRITRYLIVPTTIDFECRWLEKATIIQNRFYAEGFFQWENYKWATT